MLVDTHCHLNLGAFQADLEQVVARAREAKLERMVVVGVDLASSRRAVKLAGQFKEIYAAVGYHPHHVQKWEGKSETETEYQIERVATGLKQLIQQGKKIVAVGEIGLDYYQYQKTRYVDSRITAEIKARQKKLLTVQLQLAAEAKLPVILHTRQSLKDAMKMVGRWRGELVGGVWHCFGGSLSQAKKIVNSFEHFYIGIDGNVTYRNRKFDELRQVARWVPGGRLVVETDAPYLAPEPKRGQRCEPADVGLVVKYLSQLRKENYTQLVTRTGNNGLSLFAGMR